MSDRKIKRKIDRWSEPASAGILDDVARRLREEVSCEVKLSIAGAGAPLRPSPVVAALGVDLRCKVGMQTAEMSFRMISSLGGRTARLRREPPPAASLVLVM